MTENGERGSEAIERVPAAATGRGALQLGRDQCADARSGAEISELHLAGHVHRERQVLASALRASEALVERGDCPMASRHQRTHAELRGQRDGLAILRLGAVAIRSLSVRDIGEQTKGVSLGATLAARAGAGERATGVLADSLSRPARR